MWYRILAAGGGGARCAPLLALAVLVGCATSQAWPPRVDRLPENAAGPIAPVKPGPLAPGEIVALAREGTPSGLIIQKLRDSSTPHAISEAEAASFASQGVPADVIAYLRYGEQGIAPPVPVYVPAPYPYYGYGPYRPYGFYSPGRYGPGSHVFFGFGQRW